MMTSDPLSTSCFSRIQIEEIVVMLRLSLYNHCPHCDAQAILAELDRLGVRPLPSISTIKRILSRNCFTYGRTGYYPEDDPDQWQ